MKPWEKRLKDLSIDLEYCFRNYMEPDMFRKNTNNFLQTSRTVTFIIQKNKESIPNFDVWYTNEVRNAWESDEVMTWAKDARNVIEKEGDLDLHSSLKLSLIFSHLEEKDIIINTEKSELLNAGLKKLVRFTQKNLPTGISKSAVIKIERQWVTSSLKQRELLEALVYVYARIFDCCRSLADHLKIYLDKSIKKPLELKNLFENNNRIKYLKLNNRKQYSVKSESVRLCRNFKPNQVFIDAHNSNKLQLTNLENIFEFHVTTAEKIFHNYGHHISILFLFNENWKLVDFIGTQFEDHSDKFIFSRYIADRIITLKAFGLVWISEAWVRSFPGNYTKAIKDMPITGELLSVDIIDGAGNHKRTAWNIIRAINDNSLDLNKIEDKDNHQSIYSYFLTPATRALKNNKNAK
ncbi:hypothetical protein SIID45300_00767 [Candidatus Magnetaquicoccaceae bacterium FCR-1]|uniref:Uncharacterized protein n=1 Tax=Candidatus Magnetaquiglobus chichijimensis TaxID=3141448 RepID=A0ABQ0C6E4_9PROT